MVHVVKIGLVNETCTARSAISGAADRKPTWRTSVICRIVSIVASLVLVIVESKNPVSLAKVLFTGVPKVGGVTVEMLFAFFLFVWWAIAAGIMTFQGPFTATTNGYFATWAALLFSLLLLASTKRGVSS